MEHGLKLAGMIAAIARHFPAQADEKLNGLKKMNAEGCVGVISLDKNAPKDRKPAKPYCTYVYNTYCDNLTQAEKNSMFLGAPAPRTCKRT